MGMIAGYRRLSACERRDLWPAAWRLIWVWILLGLFGLERSRRWLSGQPVSRPAGKAALEAWTRRALALQRLGARLPGARCLARALCLWWWMRSKGLAAELRMGIRRDEYGRVSGHAWVESDGVPIDETPDAIARFQPLRWHNRDTATMFER